MSYTLTPETVAALRGRAGVAERLALSREQVLALLDAADERDRLAESVNEMVRTMTAKRQVEYGIMRPASMPDMSGRERYTQIVGATFPTEEQAHMAARRLPTLRGVPATICRRVAPGEWEPA